MNNNIEALYYNALTGLKLSSESRDTEDFMYIAVYADYDKTFPIVHLYAMKEKANERNDRPS